MNTAEARSLMTEMFEIARAAIKPGKILHTLPRPGSLSIEDPRSPTDDIELEFDHENPPMIIIGNKLLTLDDPEIDTYLLWNFSGLEIVRAINDELLGEFSAGFIGLMELAALKITIFAQLRMGRNYSGYAYTRRENQSDTQTSSGRKVYETLDSERFYNLSFRQEAGFVECKSEDLFAKLVELGVASWDTDIIDVN